MSDPINALRLQLRQLEQRQRRGELGAGQYERDKAELERRLLDRVMAGDGVAAGGTGSADAATGPGNASGAPARASTRMVALLATAVIALAVVGYAATGSPSLIFGAPPPSEAGAGRAHELDGAQFAAAVDKLAQRLQEQPENFEGWAMLGRSYMQLGRFADAIPAYAKAVALNDKDARVLVDYADALALANNRSLDGEPTRLIERALAIEPDNAKALALAGTAAFNRKDFQGAVRQWERLAAVAPPDSPFQRQLQDSIAEARQLGGLGPAPKLAAALPDQPDQPAQSARSSPSTMPQATSGAANSAAATAGGEQAAAVTGTVRLAPALAAQARPDDTVFVFARAAEGSRMPLAIVRKQVRDLPFAFTLDDAMAMAPAARLSRFPKVVVDARVSKSGQAQPSAGDLAGRSAVVANNASGVVVEINEVVRN
ncbi:MAG: tetratricopeptide repeat protein [Burkholderiales bacterium]|nr:tetratricopeptide repeat protein [Burkholderiales bacterium]